MLQSWHPSPSSVSHGILDIADEPRLVRWAISPAPMILRMLARAPTPLPSNRVKILQYAVRYLQPFRRTTTRTKASKQLGNLQRGATGDIYDVSLSVVDYQGICTQPRTGPSGRRFPVPAAGIADWETSYDSLILLVEPEAFKQVAGTW